MKIIFWGLMFFWIWIIPFNSNSHSGRTNKEGCHKRWFFKHCHNKKLQKPIKSDSQTVSEAKKLCKWTQYIIPEATGYKTCTKNPSPKNPYSWKTCGQIGGAPLWVTIPPPPAPKAKYDDYKNCAMIELNDAVKIARPIARKLKKGRNAGSRPNILNHATRRGVRTFRIQQGGGKEGIYIPSVLLNELIANWREQERRYPK